MIFKPFSVLFLLSQNVVNGLFIGKKIWFASPSPKSFWWGYLHCKPLSRIFEWLSYLVSWISETTYSKVGSCIPIPIPFLPAPLGWGGKIPIFHGGRTSQPTSFNVANVASCQLRSLEGLRLWLPRNLHHPSHHEFFWSSSTQDICKIARARKDSETFAIPPRNIFWMECEQLQFWVARILGNAQSKSWWLPNDSTSEIQVVSQ